MNIVGIDLGTTFSAVSCLNSLGKPEIIPNSDSERIMPSALIFNGEHNVTVGTEAKNSAEKYPERYVRWIKREMGESYFSQEILGKKWTPAFLSSFILKKIADEFTTQKGKIDHCVITVPAYFDETRRRATLEAGEIAKLNVLGIINEPTAAALYYATNHQIEGKTVVFDLGGGTFDVTILDVKGQNINIIATLGDHRLGGFDFDQAILNRMLLEFKKNNTVSNDELFLNYYELESVAESAKKKLSKSDSAIIRFSYEDVACSFEYTRKEFEAAISPLIARVEMLVESVLDEANMSPKDIQQVILVGGSTRMPVVDRIVENLFGFKPLRVGNVDECVALGASIYCGLLVAEKDATLLNTTVQEELNRIKLQEICSHSYGTSVVGYDEILRIDKLFNDILIPKNSKIPIEIERYYSTLRDNQTVINIDVTQGEGEDIEMVNVIASDAMSLPPNRPKGMPVLVKFSYDKNQIMKCLFIDVESNTQKSMNIDTKSGSAINDDLVDIMNMFEIE